MGDIDTHLRQLKEIDRQSGHRWTKWESGNHNFAYVEFFLSEYYYGEKKWRKRQVAR